jgi:FKBP-type peptidyl-prolyl cis-trans isomerase SlyD
MKIERKKVVQFHYTLKDAETGSEIENSRDGDPVAYLHGFNNVIKGLEAAMLGKQAGDSFSAEIAAKDAYGERNENSVQRVPIKHLLIKKNAKIKAGQVVNIQTDQGARQATVIKAGKFNVDVDTNHPLAGKALVFDIEVIDVRDATDDEVAHGHAHGVGGHHH